MNDSYFIVSTGEQRIIMDNPDLIKTQLAMMWGAYINSNTIASDVKETLSAYALTHEGSIYEITSDMKEGLRAYKPEQLCDMFAKWTDEYMALPSELIIKDINRFFTMKCEELVEKGKMMLSR
jgi:hypothetical protein